MIPQTQAFFFEARPHAVPRRKHTRQVFFGAEETRPRPAPLSLDWRINNNAGERIVNSPSLFRLRHQTSLTHSKQRCSLFRISEQIEHMPWARRLEACMSHTSIPYVMHTFAPCSVNKLDFRTGGSTKHNFPYWSEIPNWFCTIQNGVGTIQTISKTLSDLVSYW